jgi:hypothetical protein
MREDEVRRTGVIGSDQGEGLGLGLVKVVEFQVVLLVNRGCGPS